MPSKTLAHAFAEQASYCGGEGGSPLYARLFGEIAAALPTDPALQALFETRLATAGSALPLRLAAALHFLALSGRAPDYAALLPSCGGVPDLAPLWPAARVLLSAQRDTIAGFLDAAPQTNEPGRSAVLLPGFLEIDRQTGRRLGLLEIGASAGLNLHWDRYAYRLGPYRWGRSGPVMESDWRGPPASFDRHPTVVARRGCDQAPVDLSDETSRHRLEAYVWPDQPRRLDRLRAAIAVARAMPVPLDRADAADWLAEQLAHRPHGICTTIFHTVVWQYLDEAAQSAIVGMIQAAGADSDVESPLAWLRFEPDKSDSTNFRLTLSLWPGGKMRILATAHPHGTWIEWQGIE